MTAKPSAPAEFRMSARDFDTMMRGAPSAPAPKKVAPKTAIQATATKKRPSKAINS
jgi:hypothetical protein